MDETRGPIEQLPLRPPNCLQGLTNFPGRIDSSDTLTGQKVRVTPQIGGKIILGIVHPMQGSPIVNPGSKGFKRAFL